MSDQDDAGTYRKWKFVGFSEKCDLCGGTEDVHRYEHVETGEQESRCNPCEQAGGGR